MSADYGTRIAAGRHPVRGMGVNTSDWHDTTADARDAARLRQIMDGAVEHAIVEMDLNRRVRGWNVGAERLFGLSA